MTTTIGVICEGVISESVGREVNISLESRGSSFSDNVLFVVTD